MTKKIHENAELVTVQIHRTTDQDRSRLSEQIRTAPVYFQKVREQQLCAPHKIQDVHTVEDVAGKVIFRIIR